MVDHKDQPITEAEAAQPGQRRQALKNILLGSGGVVAAATAGKWVRPVVESVVLPAHGQTSTATLYKIGDTGPCGGIVFSVSNGGVNGLEAARLDQGTAAWGCVGTATGATGTAVGTGASNTAAILAASCGTSTPAAAQMASNYTGGGCSGWYLPSKDELNLLIQQQAVVGGFAGSIYWSSSEFNINRAWVQFPIGGSQNDVSKVTPGLGVRAIRSF